MRQHICIGLALLTEIVIPLAAWGTEPSPLRVCPEAIRLDSPESFEQLLVFELSDEGIPVDVTRQAAYSTLAAGVVEVSPSGQVVPVSDGHADLRVRVGKHETTVAVEVRGVAAPPPVSFQRDVVPILSKAGCNSGGCHGKAEGKNGFKLSVFGYDTAADFHAIVMEDCGRRVSPAAPDQSLLLLKATAQVPHGGGLKIERNSRWYRLLRRWIQERGAVDRQVEHLVDISVEPAEVTLSPHGSQQLRVMARYQGDHSRCVTAEGEYQSNNDAIAAASRDGLVTATDVPGEAAILVRYLGQVAICRVTRPRDEGTFARPPERNFIDPLVWDKLELLRIAPSPLADDATFLRRVFLDTIGTLPTAAEARSWLADPAPDKRRRVIAELLNRPEYADYWAQRWSDLLQVDRDAITPQGAVAMTRWVRGQIAQNAPYDEFVRAILMAQGSTLSESPAAFFQVHGDPEKLARSVSQLFLGVRIECAQCHHHPFEHWDQQDYYALAGFFTGIVRQPISQGALKIVGKDGEDMKHPRTGRPVPAAGLGAAVADLPPHADRCRTLAAWATRPENPFFTRVIVNRLWAHYMGRGLVEPLDDLRTTNPASNERLMNALTDHLIALHYDLKAFTQTLLDSYVYQLSSQVNDSNRLDLQNYSHAAWKAVPAEVLLDMISQATGVPEEFNGWPRGIRAIQIWDNRLPSHSLEVFGRPTGRSGCACERGAEPTMAQALHLMNSPTAVRKVQHRDGRAARLAASNLGTDELVDELYLAALSRFPTDGERPLMRQALARPADRREAAEDILWTLLNLREFVFNH